MLESTDLGIVGALTQQWFWALILGAGLGFGGQWLRDILDRRAKRKIATMQVATQLRAWMIDTARRVSELDDFEASGGRAGTQHGGLAKFEFEDSLDQVSLLHPKDAMRIFDLIHEKETIRSEVAAAADYVDYDEALLHLRRRAGQIYLQALPVYDHLIKSIKWIGANLPEAMTAIMRREATNEPEPPDGVNAA